MSIKIWTPTATLPYVVQRAMFFFFFERVVGRTLLSLGTLVGHIEPQRLRHCSRLNNPHVEL
jgi:hypothetical protein